MSCKEALDKAIEYLKKYADDDDIAGLHGMGCYTNPIETVDGWIKEINKLNIKDLK